MAIKGGSIVHVGNGVTVIDRIQTAGPGQLNLNTEKIFELGNFKSVSTVRDTPDLTFTMESYDVSTEIEQMLTGRVDAVGGIDLATAVPQDLSGQFKAGVNAVAPFNVISSVAMPYLNLEQMSYRFGLRDNATQSATLRGDTIFYNPGGAFVQTVVGSNAPGQTIVTANPAHAVAEGDQRRVLAVTTGTKRLAFGADYTEAYGTVTGGAAVTTVTLVAAVPVTDKVRIIYSSPSLVQYLQSVHAPVATKPAAVRGRDIEIYVGGYNPADIPGSQANKMTSIQSVQVDWRVTLDKDEEFGNYYAVGQDFDVPQVNGSVDLKPRDPAELNRLVRKFAGIADVTKVIGTSTSVPLPLDIVIKNPETGAVLKRLHVPDARFTPPGYSGRVQQKLTITVPFESDEGTLLVYTA